MKINLSFTAIQEKLSTLSTAHKVLLFVLTFALMGAAFYFLQYQE